VDNAVIVLRRAVDAGNQAAAQPAGSEAYVRALRTCEADIRDVYLSKKLPHSESMVGRRMAALREEVGASAHQEPSRAIHVLSSSPD